MMNMKITKRQIRAIAAAVIVAASTWAGFVPSAAAQQWNAPVRDPEHITQLRITSWKELRQQNIVMQQRDFSCGAAALATILRYYWGDPVSELDVLIGLDQLLTREEAFERIENGLALTDLRRVAVKMGYLSTIGRLEIHQLSESKLPLLVGIVVNGYDHFVVFRGTDGEYAYLADPARGNIRVPIGTFLDQWQKNLALIVLKPGEGPREYSPLAIRESEVTLGELTTQHIRARVLPPPTFFPLPLRQ